MIVANHWNGSGTVSDPYIIENLNINATENGYAIFIGNTSRYLTVNRCHLYSEILDADSGFKSFGGIQLYNVTNALIENNTCNGNLYGIELGYCSNNNIVANNNCSKNDCGIVLEGSIYNTISNNNCSNNNIALGGTGLELTMLSNNNTISNNTCSGNSYGIYLEGGSNDNQFFGNKGTFFKEIPTTVTVTSDYSGQYDVMPVFVISVVLFAIVTALVLSGRKKNKTQ